MWSLPSKPAFNLCSDHHFEVAENVGTEPVVLSQALEGHRLTDATKLLGLGDKVHRKRINHPTLLDPHFCAMTVKWSNRVLHRAVYRADVIQRGSCHRALGNTAPAPVTSAKAGYADVNGIKLYYSITGHGSPVILLHGGLANSDYWGNQVKALSTKHTVITFDSCGYGRSSVGHRWFL